MGCKGVYIIRTCYNDSSIVTTWNSNNESSFAYSEDSDQPGHLQTGIFQCRHEEN